MGPEMQQDIGVSHFVEMRVDRDLDPRFFGISTFILETTVKQSWAIKSQNICSSPTDEKHADQSLTFAHIDVWYNRLHIYTISHTRVFVSTLKLAFRTRSFVASPK